MISTYNHGCSALWNKYLMSYVLRVKLREGPDPREVPGGGGLRVQAGGRLPLPDQGHQGHHHQPQARRLGQNRWAHYCKKWSWSSRASPPTPGTTSGAEQVGTQCKKWSCFFTNLGHSMEGTSTKNGSSLPKVRGTTRRLINSCNSPPTNARPLR